MEMFFTETVPQAIAGRTVLTFFIVFAGGFLTSISPCIVAMIPVLVSYIGGYSSRTRKRGFLLSLIFVLGMSVTFAVMGLAAAYFGRIFGQIGSGWYYILAGVSIIMGLHLLGVLTFNLPGLKTMPVKVGGLGGTFLMGLLFGLVASPCATPVLAVIITYVAAYGEPAYGGSLLFMYGLGHGIPLIVAGTFTAVIKQMGRIQKYTRYINYGSGSLLIFLGLYLLTLAAW